MKFRWILLVALAHFLITASAVFFVLPWLFMPSGASQDFERYMHAWELANSVLTFPVGLLQSGLPIIPMVMNSLFWGWAIMAVVGMIRKPRESATTGGPTESTSVVVRPVLVAAFALAVFAFVIKPVAGGSAIGIFGFFLIALMVTRSVVRKLAHKKGWTPRRTVASLYGFMGAFLVVFILLTLAPWPCVSARGSNGDARMSFPETVSHLKRVQDRWIPFHLMMRGGIRWRTDFNVNRYFAVLNRLSPEPGWTLDYVYAYNQLGGHPVLYARRTWQVPFLTYSAYRNGATDTCTDKQPGFLLHITTDGTSEGFVQLAVLHITADQFYLFWHAGYNDERIVCDRGQLDALLAKEDVFKKPTAKEKQTAHAVDIQPVVEMLDSSVRVRLLTWTDWGGLYRKTFTFDKAFPHRLEKTEEENVVSYNCGILF